MKNKSQKLNTIGLVWSVGSPALDPKNGTNQEEQAGNGPSRRPAQGSKNEVLLNMQKETC